MKSFSVGRVLTSSVMYKALLIVLSFLFLFVTTADASVTRKRGTQATALQIEWNIVGGSGTCMGTFSGAGYPSLTDGVRTAWAQSHSNAASPLTLVAAGSSILAPAGTYTFICTDAVSGQSDSDNLTVTDCLASEYWNGTTCAPNIPRLLICPATTSYIVGNTGNLTARYWSHRASAPGCSDSGYTNVTNSTNWSSTNGSRFSVSNSIGSKGAYSAVSAGNAVVNATYGTTNAPGLAVTVSAANVPPVAEAGSNRNITLPTNSSSPTGDSATDSDGTVASTVWANTAKPAAATVTISNANTMSPTFNGLTIAGSYTFRLTVTDDDGATHTDTMTVTVNPANVPPVAEAGSNRNITLPVTSANTSGASATDSDGTVASTVWANTAKPAAATVTISNANTMSPTFNGLTIAGSYTFRLTVTDDDGATHTDTMTVTVNPAPTYSCTAPFPVAFSSYYAGDDTGLSANTPGSYSAANTGAKCEFVCNAAYWWNGSACVLPDLTAASTGPVNGASFTNLVSIAFTGEARNSAAAPVAQGGWADLEIDTDNDGVADMNWNAYPPTYSSRTGSFTQGQVKALNRTLAAGTLAPGSYRYRFHVDTDGTGVSESNESNNTSAWRSFTVTATAVPSLSATVHPSVAQTSATIGATLDNNGGSPIIANWRGTCLATTPAPSGAACVSIGGTALGAFTASRTGLTPGTTYYYRGYADNAVNRGYSPERSFTTLANVPGAITVTVQPCGTGQNFLDWPDATGAASYSIYNADTNAWIGNSLGSNYMHNGSQSTTYRYYVRANNSAGDQSANSAASAPATTLGPCPINGVCGPAARTYGFNESAFVGAFCSVGSASPAAPAFPAQGATTNWQCLGQFGGSNAACSAPRDNPPPPEVTVGDCTIALEGNTCTRDDVTWNLEAFAGPYNIRNITNSSQISGTASTSAAIPVGAGRRLTLNYGLNTINALAGGVSRASDTANASCNTAAGHFWHSLLGTPVCKAPPSINITAPSVGSGTLVRSGDTVSIEYEVNANYNVACTITGLSGGGPGTYNHVGAPGWVAATPSVTGSLTAAQVVRIDCGVVGIPSSYNSEEIRIDVIPPYQET